MVREVIENLELSAGDTALDATVGSGGHALAILEKIGPAGRLVGIDQDASIIEIAREKLGGFRDLVFLINDNFRNLNKILGDLGIAKLSAALFDLGVSSYQLDDGSRGFGIKADSRLDMRMDRSNPLSAFEAVNRLKEEDLADIIFRFGGEPASRRIAREICRERSRRAISTTKELADIVTRVAGRFYRSRSRMHPATRTFQAIRIYVNDELGALEEGLRKAVEYLEPGARICVISFHSLEDRIVKNLFREYSGKKVLKIVTRKPVGPSREEVLLNPRARSAKLRVAEKEEVPI